MGREELVVASLLNTVTDVHCLRSAFTRGTLRGSVYLECQMNDALIALLHMTPGVVRTQMGLRYHLVDPAENLSLLTMKELRNKGAVASGKWVRISKGLYRGDIGLVVGSHSWGYTVLLVPRVFSSSSVKRFGTPNRPEGKLFDSTAETVTHNSDGSYSQGRLVFEHGLVVKEYDYHAIAGDVSDMPLWNFTAFKCCGHPDVVVSNLPRPREWKFERNEKVIMCSSGMQGSFWAGQNEYAEVEMQVGLQCVPWSDIVKMIEVGSFVQVEALAFVGKCGWLVNITGNVASVIDMDSKHVSNKRYRHLHMLI